MLQDSGAALYCFSLLCIAATLSSYFSWYICGACFSICRHPPHICACDQYGLSHMSADMWHVPPCRISEYMDLSPAEVVGHTCYQFIYAEDLESLRQSHEDRERKASLCVRVCVRACEGAHQFAGKCRKKHNYFT